MPRAATVKAVGTAFEIVEELSRMGEAGVTEIADQLGIPNSTVHDHLNTLEREGYVIKSDGRYRVGTKFLDIGARERSRMSVYQTAKPQLKEIAEETGEHVTLVIEEAGVGVLLFTIMGKNAVQVVAHDGTRTWLHTTAPGKAILAHLPDDRVDAIIDRHGLQKSTQYTITEYDELMAELEEIRNRGYATDQEEVLEGMQGLAVPVTNRNTGDVLGAISVYGPKNRTDIDQLEESTPELLLQAANVIEVNVTYS